MLSRRVLLHALAVRERVADDPEQPLRRVAADLDIELDDLLTAVASLARNGLVSVGSHEGTEPVAEADGTVRLTLRGRERVLSVN